MIAYGSVQPTIILGLIVAAIIALLIALVLVERRG